MRLLQQFVFETDYDNYGKLRYEADRLGLKVTDTVFSDKVSIYMALAPDNAEHMQDFYRELTRGSQNPENLGEIWVEEYI